MTVLGFLERGFNGPPGRRGGAFGPRLALGGHGYYFCQLASVAVTQSRRQPFTRADPKARAAAGLIAPR